MSAKHVRAPAIIGKRSKRFARLVFALARAEIALQSPEGSDDRGRNPELFFFARKQSLMFLDLLHAVLQAAAGEHLVGNLNEVLRKEALSSIDIDDALIKDDVGGGCGNGGLRAVDWLLRLEQKRLHRGR